MADAGPDISGPSDVSTNGLYLASWAPYNQDSYNNQNNGWMVYRTKFVADTHLKALALVNFSCGYTDCGLAPKPRKLFDAPAFAASLKAA